MSDKKARISFAAVIFIAALLAIGHYASLAHPRPNNSPSTSTSTSTTTTVAAKFATRNTAMTADAAANGKVDSVEVMAEHLRARLEKEPNDVSGWVLLGRSYHFLERWDDAKAAFAKARALGYQGDANTAADSAESSSPAMSSTAADDGIFNDIGRIGAAAHAGALDKPQP